MTDIKALTDLCDWQLKTGSHKWPGPDGGTCINEAAIIAAGFAYKSVASASDCPPCFSPVISAYLIAVNDRMRDAPRQKLMPFVTRLSGSADTPDVERLRLEYIVIETVRRIVAMAMDAAGLTDQAAKCRAVKTFAEAAATAANAAADAAKAAATAAKYAATAAKYAAMAATAAKYAVTAAKAAIDAKYAAKYAATAATASAATAAVAAIDDHCIAIVEGALAIGNQATDMDAILVAERMNKIRNRETV